MATKTQGEVTTTEKPANNNQWVVSKALKNVRQHLGSQKDRKMSVDVPPAPSVTVNSASLIGMCSTFRIRSGPDG